METTGPIPVTLDPVEMAERLRFDPARAGFASLDELVAFAQGLIKPRGVMAVAFVGAKGEGTVEVGSVTFESGVLRQNLETINKVFPYLITVGAGLERAAASQTDLLKQYYLEEMANIALEKAAEWLSRRIEERYGVGTLSNLSPGALEDWPITEQTKLFALLGDTERSVGVCLTESMLMIPRKSVSGILFPAEVGFSACQLSDRPNCQGRKAPYNGVRPEKNKKR